MSEIKHILLESGVEEIFRLIVVSGNYAGTYEITKPNGWDEVDSKIDINDEFFNIDNFIIGDTEKIQFLEYNDPETFNLLKNVYNELGGDGQIIFKWIAVKDGEEFDLLEENFEINLNKYDEEYEKSKRKLSFEIKKRESQSKFLNREETTVDLFATKDLDDNDITPVETFTMGYKKGDRVLSNFYSFDITSSTVQTTSAKNHMFPFMRSEDFEFGINTNTSAGYWDNGFTIRNLGPFLTTDIVLKNIKIEISNLEFAIVVPGGVLKPAKIWAIIDFGGVRSRQFELARTQTPISGDTATVIKIENKITNIESLKPGESLYIVVITDDESNFSLISANTNVSITITTDLSSPLVKTQAVRVKDAIAQVCKNYTAGEILFEESKLLSMGGYYYNSSFSTGVYLRGLPSRYTVGQKIKTSFKSMFFDGLAPLLAMGYDINKDKVIIEDIGFFFKNIQSYDLSNKTFKEDDYKLTNDKDISFNQLFFGSKKYSTNVKDDIKNYNTTIETTTPLITVKNKFDKQTELIIDEYKIQELIEDGSSATNDNDDDLVLIDLVESLDYWDEAVFEDTYHEIFEGKLKLTCITTAFDTTFIEVGTIITITEGINSGTYNVLSVTNASIVLDKTAGIEVGQRDTPIKYKISDLIKNRTGSENEGFTNVAKVRDAATSANLRHNPKFHLARWFKYFGSGFTKKSTSELIKITDYKNDSEAELQVNDPVLANELQGLVKIAENEPLSRLRSQYDTFFNGKTIEITLKEIQFFEFLAVYNNWKFGIGNDLQTSRGFLTIDTPDGLLDVYPFGNDALVHNKKENELSIKAKVKGIYIENPTLLSVIQINRTTLKLEWDYDDTYLNPEINIQYSTDGLNWITIETVTNIKEAQFSSDEFLILMTGDNVSFRVLINSGEFTNRKSNILEIEWHFNDFTIKEISRTENADCGFSYLTLEIKTGSIIEFNVNCSLESDPGGSTAFFRRVDNNLELLNLSVPYGISGSDTDSFSLSINNETVQIQLVSKNTNRNELNKPLNCYGGTNELLVSAGVIIDITNNVNIDHNPFDLWSYTQKYYSVV